MVLRIPGKRPVNVPFIGIVSGGTFFFTLILTSYENVWESTSSISIAILVTTLAVSVVLLSKIVEFNGKVNIWLRYADLLLSLLFVYSLSIVWIRFGQEYAFYCIKPFIVYIFAYCLGKCFTIAKDIQIFYIGILLIGLGEVIFALYEVRAYLWDIDNLILQSPLLLKGNFSNSAMLSAFMVLCILLSVYFLKSSRTTFYKVLLTGYIGCLALIVIFINSRASYVFLVIGVLILLKVGFRYILIAFLVMMILAFQFKRDSLEGRILIWKTSYTIFQDYPVFGIGFNRFGAEYNNYQGRYFESGRGSEKEKYIAANNYYAFNIFVKVLSELGIVGACFFVMFFYHAFLKNRKKDELLDAVLYGFFVFSLFSYPLSQIELGILMFIFLGMVSVLSGESKVFRTNSVITFTVILLPLFALARNEVVNIKSVKKWEVYNRLRFSSQSLAIKLMGKNLYPVLRGYPEFLYNYGAVLCANSRYQEALPLLKQCAGMMPSSDLMILLGQAEEGIGNYVKAEGYYIQACNMVPNLFVPKYFLYNFYKSRGDLDKRVEVAEQINKMRIKVSNPKIHQIKREIALFLGGIGD